MRLPRKKQTFYTKHPFVCLLVVNVLFMALAVNILPFSYEGNDARFLSWNTSGHLMGYPRYYVFWMSVFYAWFESRPVFRTILPLKIYNTVNQITNHPKRCILGHLAPFLRYAGRTVFTPKKPLTPHVPKKSRTFAPCLWRRNRTSPAVQQSA